MRQAWSAWFLAGALSAAAPARGDGGPASWLPGLGPIVPQGKLDLPRRPAGGARVAGLAGYGSGGWDSDELNGVLHDVGAWGSRWMDKRALEERLRVGRTLPTPLLKAEQTQVYLLLPVQRLGSDARGLPIGVLFRMGFLGDKTRGS